MDLLAMNYYHAFGFYIACDFAIPEFLTCQKPESLDVQITARSLPTEINENPNQFIIAIPEIATFLIENGNRIYYQRQTNCDDETLRLFLLGSAMGALLQQRGFIVLHGNAISTDGKHCEIFVGNQGAGKSTTAAWYYQQGANILADDVCAISFAANGQPVVMPSYPQIKLWQSSADLLNISTQSLRRLRQQFEKFALPIRDQFFKQPLPVARVIEINPQLQNKQQFFGAEKLSVLKNHSYRYHFLAKMGMTNIYLKQLMQLANKIEVLSSGRITL